MKKREELESMNEEQLLDLMIKVAQDIHQQFDQDPGNAARRAYFENWRNINTVLRMKQVNYMVIPAC